MFRRCFFDFFFVTQTNNKLHRSIDQLIHRAWGGFLLKWKTRKIVDTKYLCDIVKVVHLQDRRSEKLNDKNSRAENKQFENNGDMHGNKQSPVPTNMSLVVRIFEFPSLQQATLGEKPGCLRQAIFFSKVVKEPTRYKIRNNLLLYLKEPLSSILWYVPK